MSKHVLIRAIHRKSQRGVAVVTALLLTTLAITLVASLFWQQQVQVRSIENQRFQLQKKWVLRGALDWARLILREDALANTYDHLGEPWAVTLGETRLDQYVENGKEDTDASEASLSGQISDAQARFNLNNLAENGLIKEAEVKAFARLLGHLHLNAELATELARMISQTQNKQAAAPNPNQGQNPNGAQNPNPPQNPDQSTSQNPNSGSTTDAGGGQTITPDGSGKLVTESGAEIQFMRFVQAEDLLAVAGFTPEILLKLKDFIVFLPVSTKLNLNTCSKEVLAARLGVSLTDAALIISSRDRIPFRNLNDFKLQFSDKVTPDIETTISFSTSFFLVNAKVKLSRSNLDVLSLIERNVEKTSVLWLKEI